MRLVVGLAAVVLTAVTWAGCYFDHEIHRLDVDRDGFDEAADCNDDDAAVFPGAAEICDDSIDNDCDGKLDAADPECQLDDDDDDDDDGAGGDANGGSGGTNAGGSGGDNAGGSGGTGGSGTAGSPS